LSGALASTVGFLAGNIFLIAGFEISLVPASAG